MSISSVGKATLVAGSVGLVLGGVVIALLRSHFLTFTGTPASAQVVAAALALIGVVSGVVVSFLATLLKDSYDRRTEARMDLEAKRNDAMEREAETRLKLEAAIRAVQLFATQAGTPSLPIQRAGALFMLDNLGQHDLTLSLLSQLLPSKEIDSSVASTLINSALCQKSKPNVQRAAVNLLRDHSTLFLTELGFEFPGCVIDGANGLSTYVRHWAAVALVELLLARPLKKWNEQKYSAYVVLAALTLMWRCEPDQDNRADLAALLAVIVQAFPIAGILAHPLGDIDTTTILTEVASSVPSGSFITTLIERLNLWLHERVAPSGIVQTDEPPVG
jgi:hypothetical protein